MAGAPGEIGGGRIERRDSAPGSHWKALRGKWHEQAEFVKDHRTEELE